MLAIITPFLDGFFLGLVIGIVGTAVSVYLLMGVAYRDEEKRKRNPNPGYSGKYVPYREYMDDFEEKMYHS